MNDIPGNPQIRTQNHRPDTGSMSGVLNTLTCEAYLQFRRCATAEDRTVAGEQSRATRGTAAQVIIDLVDYRELFTTDRIRADLPPWGGTTARPNCSIPEAIR
jgi:hypothetical protein